MIHLNSGHWDRAAQEALRVNLIWPLDSFVAAFALFETGDRLEALVWFLHAALNFPRSAAVLIRTGTCSEPENRDEAMDQRAGVELGNGMGAFLRRQTPESRDFFNRIMRMPRIEAMLDEIKNVIRRWHHQHRTEHREAFDRMQQMRTPEYAREQARELAPGLAIE